MAARAWGRAGGWPGSGEGVAARIPVAFYAAVLVVFAFLVFMRGMAYVGVPPLYAGEAAIVVFAVLFLRSRSLRRFARSRTGRLALVFAVLPMVYFAVEHSEVGLVDFGLFAATAYYAVFYYFGYAAVHTRQRQRRFVRLFFYGLLLLNVHCVLCAIVPLRDWGPVVNGEPFFGNGGMAGVWITAQLGYLCLFAEAIGWAKGLVMLALWSPSLLGNSLRGNLLCLAAVSLVLWRFRSTWVSRSMRYVVAALLLVALALSTGLLVSPEGFVARGLAHQVDLVMALVGRVPTLPEKAGSLAHRLAMWQRVIGQTVRSSPLLGQGFRAPIVDAAFRNPHNAFVNIFGRMGLIGLVLAVAIYIGPCFGASRAARTTPDPELRRYLVWYLCFFVSFLVVASHAPVLACPFSALVCNFMFGAGLRCVELARGEGA